MLILIFVVYFYSLNFFQIRSMVVISMKQYNLSTAQYVDRCTYL